MTTSVVQALAMGLPVIATNHSGFAEQVVDGVNGYLVPEGNHVALAEKILYYLDHSELWSDLSRAAREHALDKYDSKKMIEQQMAIYKSMQDGG